MPVEHVTTTPMEAAFTTCAWKAAQSFYTNADGSHFLVGDLFENAETGLVNLTEQYKDHRSVLRHWQTFPESERVVYRGVDEPRDRGSIHRPRLAPTVRSSQSRALKLNERGIAVHYLAFPRAGMGGGCRLYLHAASVGVRIIVVKR